MSKEELIEKFQCPGCTLGSDRKCGAFRPDSSFGLTCLSHVPGTALLGLGNGITTLALGLPKGFDRLPALRSYTGYIRIWEKGTDPGWNRFNVAVWAMEEDGYLFVRTLSPRTAKLNLDIIEGGTLALVPHAINVGEFIDSID